MKTKLARAAVVAATRIAKDGFQSISPAAVADAVADAHIALFDTDFDESTPDARRRLADAVDLACDLVNFARAIKKGRTMPDKSPETITEAKAAEAAKQRHAEHERKLWVPFPLAGDDVYLMFGLKSLEQLEKDAAKLMPGYREHGFTPFGAIEKLLLEGHPGAVRSALDAGLKRKGEPYPRGGFKAIPAADIDLDEDLPWPISEIVQPALEAIAYSSFRKTYSEMLAEAMAAAEAQAEASA